MTGERTHEALVVHQFGARAGAYLTSAVHAQGADLSGLAALVEGHEEAHVLDLGCGAGHVTFAVAPHVRDVTALDLSAEMLGTLGAAAAARGLGNVTTRQGAAESLPFADAAFTIVLSRYSAHHWRDLAASLREAARVLQPGGLLAVVDTISPAVPELDTHLQAVELLRDPSHVRDYSRAEWDRAIVGAGLVAGRVRMFSVRLDFAAWTARMQTPPAQIAAIRALQRAASARVAHRFEIGPDGSFTIAVALLEATKPRS